MFETLFGAEMPLAMRFFIAFIVVLALIGAFFWIMRRFGAERLGSGANRSRQPRLAVIDAAAVDSRRRLVLIRRDNVEHLLMIGGPSDVVVEANIVRAAAPQREMPAPRTAAPAEPLPRPAPLAEPTWPPQPEPVRPAPRAVEEPAQWSAEPEPAPPAPVEPPVRRPEPVARLQRNPESSLTAFSGDLNVRPAGDAGAMRPAPMVERIPASERRNRLAERIVPAAEPAPAVERAPAPERAPAIVERMPERVPASERMTAPERMAAPERVAPPVEIAPPVDRPMPPPPAAAPAPAAETLGANADQNLAEMAQRLEAALRRPTPAEPRSERRPAAEPAPAAAAEEPVAAPAAERPAPPPAGEPRPKPKTLYDSLEQEMASLLGRPAGKP